MFPGDIRIHGGVYPIMEMEKDFDCGGGNCLIMRPEMNTFVPNRSAKHIGQVTDPFGNN